MKAPSFWNERDLRARRSAPLTRIALTPLAALYEWAGARRIEKTIPAEVSPLVICIGNLTVGGSGKTPVVAALRAYFTEKGYRAASLSRGYKGELDGPLRVETDTHSARDVGDEPVMLAASGEAWISKDRVAGARAMEADGVEVILMDDGHQNPDLTKDLSLIVVDGGNPVGNGFVFPKGPLREPLEVGLARADAVIVMGEMSADAPDFGALVKTVMSSCVVPTAPAPKGPLVAFAGIGRPQKFFDTLTEAGAELVDAVPFPDHHAFTQSDLTYLERLADDRGAQLITTEKDHVRLNPDMRARVRTFPVTASLPEPVLDELFAQVLKRLS